MLGAAGSFEKRDGAIREIHPFLVTFNHPADRVLDVDGRAPNPAFMVAEAIWILSGTDDAWIFDYNARLRQWAQEDKIVGAYGPRLRRWSTSKIDQVQRIVDHLLDDRTSQRLTMTIFDPTIDQRWHQSVPCTNLVRYMGRDGRLDCTVVMRAQDVWWGLPYDFFTFSFLHEAIAAAAGLEVGSYHLFADVLRLYQRHWRDAEGVRPTSASALPAYAPLSCSLSEFDDLLNELASIARCPFGPVPGSMGQPWDDMAATLRAYRLYGVGRFEDAFLEWGRLTGPLRRAMARWFAQYPQPAAADLIASAVMEMSVVPCFIQ